MGKKDKETKKEKEVKYFILDKETDALIDVLVNPSGADIDQFEINYPNRYLMDEDSLLGEEDEEDILW